MRLQPIVVLGVLTALARRYPKICAAMAFEAGLLTGSTIKRLALHRSRGPRATIIDVTPVRAAPPPRKKRKRAARKPKRPATKTAVADAA
jgi:hypothetical protein